MPNDTGPCQVLQLSDFPEGAALRSPHHRQGMTLTLAPGQAAPWVSWSRVCNALVPLPTELAAPLPMSDWVLASDVRLDDNVRRAGGVITTLDVSVQRSPAGESTWAEARSATA